MSETESHAELNRYYNIKDLKYEDFVKLQNLYDSQVNTDVDRDPTEKQLCECIMMIKENWKECNLKRFILMMYEILIKNQEEKKRKKESLLLQHQDDYLSDDQPISELQKKRMQQQYARKFENSDANPRFYEERQIAKLFCSKGYGYPTARQYLGENITPNRYNNVITTIVRLSYRKLEYFIVKYVDPRHPTISREELKMIKTPLVNCRNWMTERLAENFHRFVKLTYKINTEDPEKSMIMELHMAIMDQLKKRNVTYKHHRRGQEYSGWTQEMEQHLILQYLKNTKLEEIQGELMLLYPGFRSCFELGKLRIKVERLVKFSVRKVNNDRQKFGITTPAPINDYLTNKIAKMPNAQNLRKRMLSYYLDKDSNAKKVRWVFEGVTEYLQQSKKEVEQIEDSSCEVIPKQQLKAQEIRQDPTTDIKGSKKEKKQED